jgi:hypothetical protein
VQPPVDADVFPSRAVDEVRGLECPDMDALGAPRRCEAPMKLAPLPENERDLKQVTTCVSIHDPTRDRALPLARQEARLRRMLHEAAQAEAAPSAVGIARRKR